MAWCLATLILARGHRSPYAFLFSAILLSTFSNAVYIHDQVVATGLSSLSDNYIVYEIASLASNWAIFSLYLSIIAVLWNRETAIHAATGRHVGQRNHTLAARVIYVILAVILFAFGTACPWNEYSFFIYAFGSSVIVTGVVIIVLITCQWRASRAAGITDKVIILFRARDINCNGF